MGFEHGEDEVDGSFPTNKQAISNRFQPGNVKQSCKVVEPTTVNTLTTVTSPTRRNSASTTAHIPATIVQTTKDLSNDILYHSSRLRKRKSPSKHATTLRRTVQELSEKHVILFNGTIHKLDVGPDNACGIYYNVAEEMFSDGQRNWGRIVSLYAFGARIAVHIADKHKDDKEVVKYIDNLAKFMGQYIAEKHGVWINEQGGWDSFDEHFQEKPNLENVIWKGLLVTAVGLSALASVVAAR